MLKNPKIDAGAVIAARQRIESGPLFLRFNPLFESPFVKLPYGDALTKSTVTLYTSLAALKAKESLRMAAGAQAVFDGSRGEYRTFATRFALIQHKHAPLLEAIQYDVHTWAHGDEQLAKRSLEAGFFALDGLNTNSASLEMATTWFNSGNGSSDWNPRETFNSVLADMRAASLVLNSVLAKSDLGNAYSQDLSALPKRIARAGRMGKHQAEYFYSQFRGFAIGALRELEGIARIYSLAESVAIRGSKSQKQAMRFLLLDASFVGKLKEHLFENSKADDGEGNIDYAGAALATAILLPLDTVASISNMALLANDMTSWLANELKSANAVLKNKLAELDKITMRVERKRF